MSFYLQSFLVTGANGFVGQAFCKEAIARGISARGAIRRHFLKDLLNNKT